MRTVNLVEEQHTISELLQLAKSEPVLIHDVDGADFLLEEADELEREVAALGDSEKFMSFLQSRSAESAESSADEVARCLGLGSHEGEGVEGVGGGDQPVARRAASSTGPDLH